jgi:hypothetical protein
LTNELLAKNVGNRKIAFPDDQERSQLVQRPAEGLDWLLACALGENTEKLWITLAEQDADFVKMLWRSLGLASDAPVVFCTVGDRTAVRVLTPVGVTDKLSFLPRDLIEKDLPWPPQDWCLTAAAAKQEVK